MIWELCMDSCVVCAADKVHPPREETISITHRYLSCMVIAVIDAIHCVKKQTKQLSTR